MATYSLKTMGPVLDALSNPAGRCVCCPIELEPGDWYYDPSTPYQIKHIPNNECSLSSLDCNTTDDYINEASGIKYKYFENEGMRVVGFAWSDHTYIILGEIDGAISMPANCTLIFEGGMLTSSLNGDCTTIEAGPVQIFDVGIAITGTFTNEYTYPEWWGAKATRTRDSTIPDCHSAIQAAFNSPFYKIEFATGFYYLSDTIYLNKRKHIKMQGCGVHNRFGRAPEDFALGTVLWTNNNIVVLIVDLEPVELNPSKVDFYSSLIWEGGCIDVSYCNSSLTFGSYTNIRGYTRDAIKYCPRGETRTHINIAIRGPIGYMSPNDSNFTLPEQAFPHENGEFFGGNGFHITNHTPASDGSSLFSSVFDLDIYGFGTGFLIDFEESTLNGSLTSLELHGSITNCFRYIYSPTRAFSGGVIDCTIQTAHQNDSYPNVRTYLIEGNLDECYLNSFIWDYSSNLALKLTNWEKTRLGPRILTILSNLNYEMMMSPIDVAGLIDEGDGLLNASVGAYDLRQLGAINGTIKGRNYIHTIDNDLLGYDKMWGQEDQIAARRIQVVTSGLDDVTILNTSPFDSEGFKMDFNPTVLNMSNASLRVTIPMPTNSEFENSQVRVMLLVVHLKGINFTYFRKMTVTATRRMFNDSRTLFENSYAGVSDGFNDVVVPLLFPEPFSIGELTFLFEDLGNIAIAWQDNGNVPNTVRFKFAVEGRFNIHSHNNIWSASGGDMGKNILRLGKPYLLGTKKYASLSDLPSNASLGAIGLVNEIYPIMNTPNGWMIQNLAGTLNVLKTLNSSIGPLSIGQEAFVTDYRLRANWAGSQWLFDRLVMTASELNSLHVLLGYFAVGQIAYVYDYDVEVQFTSNGWIDLSTGDNIDFPDE